MGHPEQDETQKGTETGALCPVEASESRGRAAGGKEGVSKYLRLN